jgi:hypothetical protein
MSEKIRFTVRETLLGRNYTDLHNDGYFIADYIEPYGTNDSWWIAHGRHYYEEGYEPSAIINTLMFKVDNPDIDESYPDKWTAGQIFNLSWVEYRLG